MRANEQNTWGKKALSWLLAAVTALMLLTLLPLGTLTAFAAACTDCNGTGKVDCSSCTGVGNVVCQTCDGDGDYAQDGIDTCDTCGQPGTLGNGCLTKVPCTGVVRAFYMCGVDSFHGASAPKNADDTYGDCIHCAGDDNNCTEFYTYFCTTNGASTAHVHVQNNERPSSFTQDIIGSCPDFFKGTVHCSGTIVHEPHCNMCSDTGRRDCVSCEEGKVRCQDCDGTGEIDDILPTVLDVSPKGTDAPLSGNLVITFSEPMNLDGQIDGGDKSTVGLGRSTEMVKSYQESDVLDEEHWSPDHTVLTIEYNGLLANTEYYIHIMGFEDVAGNEMSDDDSHSFTTGAGATNLVTVNSGTGSGNYAAGATVTIAANTAPDGQQFKEWTIQGGGVALANAQAQSTTFIMPANAVTATATYEALPAGTYSITVQTDGNGTANANVNAAQQGASITLTATPNTGYRFKQWQVIDGGVTVTDNKFIMPAKNVTIKAIFEETSEPKYTIKGGANSSCNADTTSDVAITCDGDFSKFTGIKVDGAVISAGNFTAVSGSTVVTLKAAYLKTLAVGTHTVEFVYTDGSVQTNLTILAVGTSAPNDPSKPADTRGPASPQTGDNSNPVLWLLLGGASLAVLGGIMVAVWKRKKVQGR